MKRNKCFLVILTIAIMWTILPIRVSADASTISGDIQRIEEEVPKWMEKGKIPGLSLVVIKGDQPVYIKSFGYADLEKETPVSPETLFELGSCSKAFTALAALKLQEEGQLDLHKPVSFYLPWFHVTFQDKKVDITVKQLLHHTSGIPTEMLRKIKPGGDTGALQKTVRNIVGTPLEHQPGTRFEYSTVNYDIVGHIIEKVSGSTFEDYLLKEVFTPLGLTRTRAGIDQFAPPAQMAVGYKIGFFKPRRFRSPVYRGNTPAAYVITNASDIARWLRIQLGMEQVGNSPGTLISKSHAADLSVKPDPATLASYGSGWFVYPYENGSIFHAGLNPNFTSYIHFNKDKQLGVAVLANSNSNAARFIGTSVIRLLNQRDLTEFNFDDSVDKSSSVISIILSVCLLGVAAFFVLWAIDLIKGRRSYQPVTTRTILKFIGAPFLLAPFLLGVYLLPWALSNVNWETALVWAPASFKTVIILIAACVALGIVGYILSTLYPQDNKYLKSAPMLIILSLLTGGANAIVIFLITSALYTTVNLVYLLYYFVMAMVVYIWGRKIVQTRLIHITFDIVYDLRMKLIRKIFNTSFQRFEKIDRGRIFTTLNNDTAQIGNTANIFVGLVTSIITSVGAFVYLATIAFWATMVTTLVIAVIATLYYEVTRRTQRYFEEARDTQNVYMRLLNGMIDGFKELSIHLGKKNEYDADIEESSSQFREKSSLSRVKFLHAFLIGESLLVVVLGAVGFAVPRLFPDITRITLMSFIMVLLYLIGPINAILNSIPGIMQLRVAWDRVREFSEDIPANIEPGKLVPLDTGSLEVESLKIQGLEFKYKTESQFEFEDEVIEEEDDEMFSIGPIDFEVNRGEVIFIVGGNGSGKTTLAKVLTGLYNKNGGDIKINDRSVPQNQLGEYFSVVFGGYHLFEKLYEIDLNKKGIEANQYLKILRLENKVEFIADSFSTIDLSGGQRKRLALLLCFLENRPIFLFDEVAADQDPAFRKFFYRELLQDMRRAGKIVIAITHDDHYFDAADKVIRMDMGKMEVLENARYDKNLSQLSATS